MKKKYILPLVAALAVVAPVSLNAGNKNGLPKAPKQETEADKAEKEAAKFDKSKNGIIDGDEIEAIEKALEAHPHGPLSHYDTNKDGKLSKSEIAVIKVHHTK